MIRLLAFALHADERLRFTKGLSAEEEPDLWRKSLSDNIKLWIELGLPSAKRLKKACGRAKQIIVYTYGTGSADQWWKQIPPQVARFGNLSIHHIDSNITTGVPALQTTFLPFKRGTLPEGSSHVCRSSHSFRRRTSPNRPNEGGLAAKSLAAGSLDVSCPTGRCETGRVGFKGVNQIHDSEMGRTDWGPVVMHALVVIGAVCWHQSWCFLVKVF